MNRLIIVGNGFDLSLGLETRFIDFLNYYTKNFISDYINKYGSIGYGRPTIQEDKLMSFKYETLNPHILSRLQEINDFDEFVSEFQESQNLVLISDLLRMYSEQIQKRNNWVDFEILYFETLVQVHEDSNGNKEKIGIYNEQFEFIKSEFIEYLKNQVKENSNKLSNLYSRRFKKEYKNIFYEDFSLSIVMEPNDDYQLMFLNFNYTNLLREFTDQSIYRDSRININYIHGEINDEKNPIIMGFGDEHDVNYKILESEKNHDLFKYIKSVNYFKTRNYQTLHKFIESDEFDVLVVGHSCGLSDRTLLREIFENKNCESIKLFYYRDKDGNSDYFEKSVEVMRHFENKTLVRQRVVYDEKNRMIQLSDYKN